MPKKILVADDDPDVISVVQEKLESIGYEVIVARDGKEGLEKVRKHSPDLAILDILMPEMDGVSIAASLKLDMETRGIPIIFLTGFIHKDKEKQFREELQNAYFLTKPFTIKELVSLVEQALAGKK